MNTNQLQNINIVSCNLLPTPNQVRGDFPLSQSAEDTVYQARETLHRILSEEDPRIFAVVGPCSIHDIHAALEYAHRLKTLADRIKNTCFLLMRVYFEKPRTTVGWKGFINDPFLDDSFRIDEGLRQGRKLLLDINELGLPVATEALDPINPQYFDDLIAWVAIGARTVESQTHREMASGLSAPVGFKNGTDGNIMVALNALKAVSNSHHFLGMNRDGQCCIYHTSGNQYAHMVLRGGVHPNFESTDIARCEKALKEAGLSLNIMVDCSHGNSLKRPEFQPRVLKDITQQIINGNRSIKGLMIESNLFGGKQSLTRDLSALKYGVSITDSCLNWSKTETILLEAADTLTPVLADRFSF